MQPSAKKEPSVGAMTSEQAYQSFLKVNQLQDTEANCALFYGGIQWTLQRGSDAFKSFTPYRRT